MQEEVWKNQSYVIKSPPQTIWGFEILRIVPVENLLGGDGEGWKIAMATAGFERGLMLRSPARFQQTAAKLLNLYIENEEHCSPMMQSKIVEAWAQSESYALSIYHTASKMLAGGSIGSESSLLPVEVLVCSF